MWPRGENKLESACNSMYGANITSHTSHCTGINGVSDTTNSEYFTHPLPLFVLEILHKHKATVITNIWLTWEPVICQFPDDISQVCQGLVFILHNIVWFGMLKAQG